MKFVALFGALPVLAAVGLLGRTRQQVRLALVGLVGFLPFIGEAVSMNLYVVPEYHGDSIGLEVTLLDLVVVGLAFAAPPAKRPAPYGVARWAYLIWACFSLLGAPEPLFGLFSIWKLGRMYFLLAVLARALEEPAMAPALLRGLATGCVYATLIALEQRYRFGMLRCRGPLPHSNSLGMGVNMVFCLGLAVSLAGQGGWLARASMGGAAVCVILSQSRVCLAMLVLASGLIFLGSVARRLSGQKLRFAAAMVLAGSLVALQSVDSILERMATAPKESAEAREKFNEAAGMMLGEHPFFGIGINQYSHVLGHEGYAERVDLPEVDHQGVAHHIYWLTAAELGAPGLVLYLLVLFAPLAAALRGSLRARRDIRGDVLLGCAVALSITHVQGLAEWVLRQSELSALFWSIAALIDALRRQIRPLS